jgi:hypothetical protein
MENHPQPVDMVQVVQQLTSMYKAPSSRVQSPVLSSHPPKIKKKQKKGKRKQNLNHPIFVNWKISIVKMFLLPKAICRLNTMLI